MCFVSFCFGYFFHFFIFVLFFIFCTNVLVLCCCLPDTICAVSGRCNLPKSVVLNFRVHSADSIYLKAASFVIILVYREMVIKSV